MWRYMDFTKFVSLLEKKALFFCRADKLGDPFEGSIPNTESSLSKKGNSINLESLKSMIYINCWNESTFESEAMWKLYTREKNGIAIKTTFINYKTALNDPLKSKNSDVYVSKIRYIDYKTNPIESPNPITLYIYKRNSFQHEMEIRALYVPVNTPEIKENLNGIYYGVDLKILIQEIVIAPFAEKWFSELTKSISRRYGLYDRVRHSTLDDAPNFIRHFQPKLEKSNEGE